MSTRRHLVFILIAVLLACSPAAPSKNKKIGSALVAQGVTRVLWNNPGAVEELDFAAGPGGPLKAPRPPFRFLEEDLGGSNPKVKVTDAAGSRWSVKWGSEVHAEVFAARLAWGAGYHVTPNYFVARGQIQKAKGLTRAKKHVDAQGNFTDASFSLRDTSLPLLKTENWTWKENPFVGARELNGLKIVLMLTSNWDNKNSNTGILVQGRMTWIYLVTDWGASMGKWGGVAEREKWDCAGYAEQTSHFIKGVDEGMVKWGFHGQRTEDATQGIRLEDVKWLLQYLGRISDRQIRSGLQASGAAPEEVECFTQAVRQRIMQMHSLVGSN